MSTNTDKKQRLIVRVGWCILLVAIGFFVILSLGSDGYDVQEHMGRPVDIQGMIAIPNLCKAPGSIVAGILAISLGDTAYMLGALFIFWGLKILISGFHGAIITRILGVILLFFAATLMHQSIAPAGSLNDHAGGALGNFLADYFKEAEIPFLTMTLTCVVVGLLGFFLSIDLTLIQIFGFLYDGLIGLVKLAVLLLFRTGRLFFWFFQNPAKPKIAKAGVPDEEDLQPIDPLSSELPEAAFNPEDEQVKVSFFTRLKNTILPGRGRDESELIAEEDGKSVFPEPEIHIAGITEASEAFPEPPVEEPLKAVYEQASVERVPVSAAPFDSIPGLEEEAQKIAEASATPTPTPTSVRVEATAQEENIQEEIQEVTAELEHRAERVETALPEPVSTPAPSPTPAPAFSAASVEEETISDAEAPVLFRRVAGEDAVPEGYKYPTKYTTPSIDLFTKPTPHIVPNLRQKLGEMALQLEETFRTFKLNTTVTDITRGPTITRFELEPEPGIKVNRFLSFVDDISLALKARGVRVEAPIPGKKRVGVEISNEEKDPVLIRELLEHPSFDKGRNTLALALGKDVAGDICIADLATMPHLLVAGATGSGKTVCIKALLAGMLYLYTPDELQLLLIDPKMVEFSIFNDIPHLITPVVTECDKAAGALSWLIVEMEERYRLFKSLQVRNIEVYNESVENGEILMSGNENNGNNDSSVSVVRKLPYIVCIIDELSDLMMLARADVETALARLAQLARAVGIHLIVATQRPSVDVLTGVIKANFPARTSFRVSSRVDSRCILDEIGAERLLGYGDMLFQGGQFQQMRLQGAFVSDEEMMALITYLKRQAPPQYRDEIKDFGKTKSSLENLEDQEDPLLEDAINVVLDTGQASISMVQRRLRVGYTRAARLIDMMELRGIVGPHTGSKARDILVADKPIKEEYHDG